MIVLAMTGAAATPGGIASSNLNVLQTLSALSKRSGRRLVVLSLHEHDSDRPEFLDEQSMFVGFRGSKWAYALRLISSFRRTGFYVFDHVRLGLPLVPMIFFGFRGFVVLAHGSESWKRVRGMSKWLFRRAQMCVTNSQFTLSRMQETFSGFEGRSCALGLPPSHDVDTMEWARAGAASTLLAVDGRTRDLGEQVILLVGRMDKGEREKGHYELLAVWPEVLNDYPRAQLVFAGPGNDRSDLVALAARLGVASTVFIPGYLSAETLRSLYSRCYAFVMPSRQEGFGLVYLEAMHAGKPCVGCRGGGGEEIIEDRVSGLLIDNPFDNEQLLRTVRRLLEDEQLAARLGHEGARRVHEQFTAARAQRRLKHLLAPLL